MMTPHTETPQVETHIYVSVSFTSYFIITCITLFNGIYFLLHELHSSIVLIYYMF
jgi:hypothetical protein